MNQIICDIRYQSDKGMRRQVIKEPVSPLMQYVRPGLNLQRLEQIKAIFDLFDTNQTGKINPKDFKQALHQEGKQVQGTPLYQLACDLDEEGKGWIDFENFIYFLNESVTGDEPEEELRKIFSLFDDEKTGFITISGLRRVTKLLNLPLEEVDLEQMMKQADVDQDGFVSFAEFKEILSYRP